nr:hypothetical protein [Tanacetum cinerariifolium]
MVRGFRRYKTKDEALRNKAIMECLINDDESSNDCWKRWKSHEIYYHNYDEGEYENETHDERHELCGIKTRKVLVCQMKRYKMIKYSFNNEEDYVAVKEDEYDDLTITSKEACRAYQEIFLDDRRRMDGYTHQARILELKRIYFEDYNSDYQYAVSIKEDMAYPCMYSPKTTSNKSFPACRVKSVESTALLEKCYEIRKLESMSYHARGACLSP